MPGEVAIPAAAREIIAAVTNVRIDIADEIIRLISSFAVAAATVRW